MSRINGQKSRSAVARRRRNVMRIRSRQLRKSFLEGNRKPPKPRRERPFPPKAVEPPPAVAAPPTPEETPKRAKRKASEKPTE